MRDSKMRKIIEMLSNRLGKLEADVGKTLYEIGVRIERLENDGRLEVVENEHVGSKLRAFGAQVDQLSEEVMALAVAVSEIERAVPS